MLDSMRRASSGWVAKGLFSLLVLAFAVWGIPHDFLSFSNRWIAKVGAVEISPDRFQNDYRDELNAISQQAGRRITPDEAKRFGLDARVLSQIVGKTAIDEHARELNLQLSDATLAEGVRRDPTFKGLDGKFSKTDFDGLLRQMGLSERGFLMMRRRDEQRAMLTGAIAAANTVPKAAVDMIHAYRAETRTVEHVTIDVDKAIKVPEPDEAKLKDAYEKAKTRYMTPELRKLAVLSVPLELVKKRMSVTDDEIKSAYDADAERYNTPEKRRILQVSFKDKAAAEAASKAIKGGKKFEDVAKEAGAKPTDIDLGLLTRKQIIDPKIADAAFALAKDAVSDVVEGRFATVLLKVAAVEAGLVKKLDDVKAEVKDRIAKDKAQGEIQKLHDKIDDARSGQKALADVAKLLELPFLDVPAVSRDNKTSDGKRAIDTAEGDIIAQAGFEAQVGVEKEAIELPDGGYAWVDLLSVAEPKQKPFEEVRGDVKTAWFDGERKRLLAELAAKLVERVTGGETLEKIAGEVGGKVETALKITRETLPQGLAKNAVTQAFALPKGRAGTTDSADNKSRVVFKVLEITPAGEPTKEQADRITGELARQAEGDAIAAYVAGLQDRLGVRIDEANLKRVMGADR